MNDIDKLNKLLGEHYGKTLDGKPKFRVAFSEDLFEYRHGNFVDYYGSIVIRDVVETRYTKKYNYLKDQYVLESWVHENMAHTLKGSENGHYEYRMAFKKDADGRPIKPTWPVLQFLCKLLLSGVKATVSDYKDMEAKDREAFINEATDILSNEVPFLAGKLANGTAVVNPGVN